MNGAEQSARKRRMARINPFTLTRPKRPEFTKTFTDPEQPGKEITLTLSPVSPDLALLAYEKAEAQYDDLVGDGNAEDAQLPPGLQGTVISKTLLHSAALLGAMQRQEPEEDRYTVLELVAIAMNMPTAWRNIGKFSAEVQKGEVKAGNAEAGQPTTG